MHAAPLSGGYLSMGASATSILHAFFSFCHRSMREEEDEREPSSVMDQQQIGRVTSSKRRSSSSSSRSHSGTSQQHQQEEEEGMVARCLILLAQQQQGPHHHHHQSSSSSKCNNNTAYECKTCNRCFPSFQALGGHRTSHTNNGNKKPRRPETEAVTTTLSLRTSAAHECSACGAAFSSGQALGGHMRRHRPTVTESSSVVTSTSSRSRMQGLDLNLLPAPSTEQEVTSPAKRVHHHFN